MGDGRRAILKATSWQFLGLVITMGVTYVLTGSLAEASALSLTLQSTAWVVYILHEKLWDRLLPRPQERR